MKIGEVAEFTSTPASTLRYYEEIGLLPKAGRVSGQRFYDESFIWRITFINQAKLTGFNLDEIKSFMNSEDDLTDWRQLIKDKLVEIGEVIEKYQKMQGLLNHVLQENCLDMGMEAFASKENN